MATLSGFADLTGKVADGTIGTTASDTINTTGMQPFSVRGPTAHGGPSQKTNGPAQPLGLKRAHGSSVVWHDSDPQGLDVVPPGPLPETNQWEKRPRKKRPRQLLSTAQRSVNRKRYPETEEEQVPVRHRYGARDEVHDGSMEHWQIRLNYQSPADSRSDACLTGSLYPMKRAHKEEEWEKRRKLEECFDVTCERLTTNKGCDNLQMSAFVHLNHDLIPHRPAHTTPQYCA